MDCLGAGDKEHMLPALEDLTRLPALGGGAAVRDPEIRI